MAAGEVIVEWTKMAIDNIYAIHFYLEERSVPASYEVVNRISSAVRTLEDFPEIGRPGRIAGTRELTVRRTPYVVAYAIGPPSIWVLAVLHNAQRWPRSFHGTGDAL